MGIVFLDIDGVLNSHSFVRNCPNGVKGGLWSIDPSAVSLLNELVEQTKCKIVVHSTWAKNRTVEELRDLLQTYGFKHPASIIDTAYSHKRLEKIEEWAKENIASTEQYIILDDAFIKSERLVQCNISWGFTRQQLEEAIEWLK